MKKKKFLIKLWHFLTFIDFWGNWTIRGASFKATQFWSRNLVKMVWLWSKDCQWKIKWKIFWRNCILRREFEPIRFWTKNWRWKIKWKSKFLVKKCIDKITTSRYFQFFKGFWRNWTLGGFESIKFWSKECRWKSKWKCKWFLNFSLKCIFMKL